MNGSSNMSLFRTIACALTRFTLIPVLAVSGCAVDASGHANQGRAIGDTDEEMSIPENAIRIDPEVIISDDMPVELQEHIRRYPYVMPTIAAPAEDTLEFKSFGITPRFQVKTSDISGAGTDAHVYIWVHDSVLGWEPNNGSSPGWNLNLPNHDDFERDEFDTYLLTGESQESSVDFIFLVRDNVGTNPEWHVDFVNTLSLVGSSGSDQKRCTINAWVTPSGVQPACSKF